MTNLFRDYFFSPILISLLKEMFDKSGLSSIDDLPSEMIRNKKLQSEFKAKMAIAMSKKYNELGSDYSPDDMLVTVDENGIDVRCNKVLSKGNDEQI